MTLKEIEASSKDILTACEVSEALKCDPQLVRWAAKHHPNTLGFPVIVIRNRVKIPRKAFLAFMDGSSFFNGVPIDHN